MAKQKKKAKWSRDRIHDEILRLDAKTGLNGSLVTIRLYPEPEPLGCFTFLDPVRMTFGFSSARFEEAGFTDAEALDVIRHEYAHFMEYRLFGESTDHGPNWKQCCRMIGARPEALYTEKWKSEARQRERERIRKTRIDGLTPGKFVQHPAFGRGIIESVERLPTMTILRIRFGEELRALDVEWVRTHCL